MNLKEELKNLKNSAFRYIQENRDTIQKLQRQVNCGIIGHQFQLFAAERYLANLNDPQKDKYTGSFFCSKCGIKQNRELTQKEIESAKKLGFIS